MIVTQSYSSVYPIGVSSQTPGGAVLSLSQYSISFRAFSSCSSVIGLSLVPSSIVVQSIGSLLTGSKTMFSSILSLHSSASNSIPACFIIILRISVVRVIENKYGLLLTSSSGSNSHRSGYSSSSLRYVSIIFFTVDTDTNSSHPSRSLLTKLDTVRSTPVSNCSSGSIPEADGRHTSRVNSFSNTSTEISLIPFRNVHCRSSYEWSSK